MRKHTGAKQFMQCAELSLPNKTKKGNSLTPEAKIENNDIQLLNYVHTDTAARFYTPEKEKERETYARQDEQVKKCNNTHAYHSISEATKTSECSASPLPVRAKRALQHRILEGAPHDQQAGIVPCGRRDSASAKCFHAQRPKTTRWDHPRTAQRSSGHPSKKTKKISQTHII